MSEPESMETVADLIRKSDRAWYRYLGGKAVIDAISSAASGEQVPQWFQSAMDAVWERQRTEMSLAAAAVVAAAREFQEQA